jgi:hypothetical protein
LPAGCSPPTRARIEFHIELRQRRAHGLRQEVARAPPAAVVVRDAH